MFFLEADPGRWGGRSPSRFGPSNFSRAFGARTPPLPFPMRGCLANDSQYRFLMRVNLAEIICVYFCLFPRVGIAGVRRTRLHNLINLFVLRRQPRRRREENFDICPPLHRNSIGWSSLSHCTSMPRQGMLQSLRVGPLRVHVPTPATI